MRGIQMFAHNNGLLSYSTMAYCSALTARAHLPEVPLSLVTDEDTWNQLLEDHPKAESLFEYPVIVEEDGNQSRPFEMSDGRRERAPYRNTSRLRAYELSPFDETLMLDTDLLVLDNSLGKLWGSKHPVCMNHQVDDLIQSKPSEYRLSDKSVRTLWATICYFRKCSGAEDFFHVAQTIASEYDYYSLLYENPSSLLRVDYVLSIANHVMSGYIAGDNTFVQPLPNPRTLFAWPRHAILNVEADAVTFSVRERNHILPVKVRRTVHCMNKDSLLEHASRVIEIYE